MLKIRIFFVIAGIGLLGLSVHTFINGMTLIALLILLYSGIFFYLQNCLKKGKNKTKQKW